MRVLLAAITFFVSAGCDAESPSGSRTDNQVISMSQEQVVAGKRKLAQEMSDFTSERAQQNSRDAELRGSREMLAHQQKYLGYSPITGSGVQQMHSERNAVLQRQADRVGQGVALLKAGLALDKALKNFDGQPASSKNLDAKIAGALRVFQASSIVSKDERLNFQRKFDQLSDAQKVAELAETGAAR